MSSPLPIDLRTSPLWRVALSVLAALALLSLWLSGAPRWALLTVPVLLLLAWPRAVAGRLVRLLLHPDGAVTGGARDGSEAAVVVEKLQWRGPLCVVTVVDGRRRQRYLLTSDILSPSRRRGLRLWFDRFHPDSRTGGAVAHV